MQGLDVVLLTVGVVAIGIAVVSRLIRRVPIAEPIVAVAAGVAIGPAGLALVELPPGDDGLLLVELAARITLALGLMAVALRLPYDDLRASWRSVALLVGLLMPLMWLATGLLAWWILGLPVLVAALLGAILTPTDPIVASTIVVGDFVERRVPARVRRAISAESGFNDGLAVPFVMAPLVALGAAPREGALGALAIGWAVVGGVLLGVAAGYGAGLLLRWAEAHETIERASFLAYTLALSLGVLGGAPLIGAEGLIAVFIAGLAFDRAVSNRERVAEERVQEAVGQFFILPAFVVFGVVLPWDSWFALGWAAPTVVVGVLLLRRLPAMLLVGRLVPDLRQWRETLFVGWFGPIGVAAIYYASLATRAHGDERLWAASTLVIAGSILVHGMTADPFIRLFASAEMRRRALVTR